MSALSLVSAVVSRSASAVGSIVGTACGTDAAGLLATLPLDGEHAARTVASAAATVTAIRQRAAPTSPSPGNVFCEGDHAGAGLECATGVDGQTSSTNEGQLPRAYESPATIVYWVPSNRSIALL